jgi:hypothetical protein
MLGFFFKDYKWECIYFVLKINQGDLSFWNFESNMTYVTFNSLGPLDFHF